MRIFLPFTSCTILTAFAIMLGGFNLRHLLMDPKKVSCRRALSA